MAEGSIPTKGVFSEISEDHKRTFCIAKTRASSNIPLDKYALPEIGCGIVFTS